MKHTNKKGFTIVELVIVIAVIAILAAVLIPNLSRLVTKADKSAAMQEAKAAMDNDLINAEGALENMQDYTLSDNESELATDDKTLKGKQVYVIATYSSKVENKTLYVIKANTDGVLKVATDETTGTFYEVSAFNGKYTGTTESGTYEYTTKDGKYVCKLVTGGEWAIDEVAGN